MTDDPNIAVARALAAVGDRLSAIDRRFLWSWQHALERWEALRIGEKRLELLRRAVASYENGEAAKFTPIETRGVRSKNICSSP